MEEFLERTFWGNTVYSWLFGDYSRCDNRDSFVSVHRSQKVEKMVGIHHRYLGRYAGLWS